jgi:hypothetical protein
VSEGKPVAVIDDRSSGAAVELDELGVVTPEIEDQPFYRAAFLVRRGDHRRTKMPAGQLLDVITTTSR